MSAKQIKNRIVRKGRGWVFTPADFRNLGSRTAVDQTLSRLTKAGMIRRLTNGIYDYPKHSALLGTLSPQPDDIAQAVARRDGHQLQVPPALAANYFGLTTQVPAKPVYLTSGPTRQRAVGPYTIQFLHRSPKKLVGAGKTSGLVFQALSYLGKDGIDDDALHLIAQKITLSDRDDLLQDSLTVPVWMQAAAQRLAAV